jgi:hypothetical protein
MDMLKECGKEGTPGCDAGCRGKCELFEITMVY